MDLKQYTKYFNYGYFLSKFEPTFLRKLLNATGDDSELTKPLQAGKSQHNKEQILEKLKGLSKKSQGSKEKEKGFEPEI